MGLPVQLSDSSPYRDSTDIQLVLLTTIGLMMPLEKYMIGFTSWSSPLPSVSWITFSMMPTVGLWMSSLLKYFVGNA
jgi:hypothetical protein